MRYRVVAVGKLKEPFYVEGCAHFLRRLRRYAPCEVVEVPSARVRDPREAREAESAALLAQAKGHAVALDERGGRFTTSTLAERVAELESRGVRVLSFLVGGAEGHAPRLRQAAAESWSLSPLTLPHDLARLVLLEQLYRVETLRAGHPYHRE